MKVKSKVKFIVAITLLILSTFSFLRLATAFSESTTTVTNLPQPSSGASTASTLPLPQNPIIAAREITQTEIKEIRNRVGDYQSGKNYNQVVNGHGTGLQPPTVDQWSLLSENAQVINNVSYSNTPLSIDNSKSPYFPPIGNQGTQGSCTAWAVSYYTKTFQEAKEQGWNLAGGPSNEIMSPSFVYNLINGGTDDGSNIYSAIDLICGVGDCSLAKMPFNQADYSSWPSENAWKEAAQYRSNGTSFDYMFLDDDNGLQNLKSWLSSGNLAVISVDSYKIQDKTWGYSLLNSKDMLTLDNYNNPSTNHAVTIVGYDDNMSYTEQGQTHYGAFKIANSWGISLLPSPFSWEHILDGCFWISYSAMKQEVQNCYVFDNLISYQPETLATFNINDSVRSNCYVTVGMGDPNQPIITKTFNDYISGGNHPFCQNNIVMDITEFKNYVPSVYNQSFFLDIYDFQSIPATGTVKYFAIGNFSALGTPCQTIRYQDIFLNVSYNPTVSSSISLLPVGSSAP